MLLSAISVSAVWCCCLLYGSAVVASVTAVAVSADSVAVSVSSVAFICCFCICYPSTLPSGYFMQALQETHAAC